MKKLLISILFITTFILANSQDFYVSPGYYPTESEIALKWTPEVSLEVDTYQCPGWFKRNARPLGIIAYHLGTVALGSTADGLYDEGHKEWAHALHALEVGALISGPFIFKIKLNEAGWYIVSYGALRFATFDLGYNTVRGLPPLYNGSTSWYDQTMSKMPDHGEVWVKSISFTLGIAIPFNELK